MNNEKGFKNLFAKKELQDTRTVDSDDYTVVKNSRVDMALRIFSLLCAIALWIAIVIGDSTTKEFTNVTVKEKGSSIVRRSYTIEYDYTQVNFVLQGKGNQISQIADSDIIVYVDFSSVTTQLDGLSSSSGPQTFDLPLVYELTRKDVTAVFLQKSKESIKVTFTKKTT